MPNNSTENQMVCRTVKVTRTETREVEVEIYADASWSDIDVESCAIDKSSDIDFVSEGKSVCVDYSAEIIGY